MLDKIEKKLYKYSISNLIRYVIFILIIGYCINLCDPNFYNTYLSLDFSKIKEGEIWRLFTFILYNKTGTDIFSMLMYSISLMFYYFIGNSLELFWGKFWFNTYVFFGIFFNIIGSLIVYLCTGMNVSIGLQYVLESLFLAFAVLFPELKVNLYFLIPLKIKWLGYLYGGLLLFNAITYFWVGTKESISIGVCILVSVLNFILFAILVKKRQKKQTHMLNRMLSDILSASNKRAKDEQSGNNESIDYPKMKAKKDYLHKCCICGKTDVNNPDLEFRYCSKCKGEHEYCNDHLFTHEHKK